MATAAPGNYANVGKTIQIKGELSGNEDIYVDGSLEGHIQLSGSSLTVGPNGRVHANVTAKSVVVSGSLQGNIQASERTELRKTAVVNGDVQTRRIAIEEGAYFKGKLEILTDKPASAGPSSSVSPSAGPTPQSMSTGPAAGAGSNAPTDKK
jgi:cytoskeletal protein CcmA (bactofilin family)